LDFGWCTRQHLVWRDVARVIFLGLSGQPLSPRAQRFQNLKQAQKLIYRAVCIQCFSVQRCVTAKLCSEVRRRVNRHRRFEIWQDKAHGDAPVGDLFGFPDTDFERYIKVEAHIAQMCRQNAIGILLGVTAVICLKGSGYKLAQVPLLIGNPMNSNLPSSVTPKMRI